MPQNKFTYIDLFAGCGGLSLGLHKAGWKGLFAIEKSPDAFKTLSHNLIENRKHFDWPNWLPQKPHNINTILETQKEQLEKLCKKVDLVTGGPPCQGFSTAGKRNEEDKRNSLIKSYIKFIKIVQPKLLFFENVKGFTMEFDKNKSRGKKYSIYVIDELEKAGYNVHGEMLDFSEYGIPQKRCRFILVGVRTDIVKKNKILAEDFFNSLEKNRKPFFISKDLTMNPNLEDAISDLLMKHGTETSPDTKNFQAGKYSSAFSSYQKFLRGKLEKGTIADSHRFVNHTEKVKNRFAEILSFAKRNTSLNDEIKERYGLKKRTIVPLNGKATSPTITTLPDDYIHYCEARILTVREYARIQSFPDDYAFKGKYTTGGKQRIMEVPRYTQIGNAIPPLFGEQSGIVLKKIINE
jgi:DNA (cytosine-5)-methyltransferase 1